MAYGYADVWFISSSMVARQAWPGVLRACLLWYSVHIVPFSVFFLRTIAEQFLTVNTYVASESGDPICISALAALLGYNGAPGVLFL